MDITTLLIQTVAAVAGGLVALMSIPLFLRLRWPAPALWFIKLYCSAWSAWLWAIALGILTAGITTHSFFISIIGAYDLIIFSIHIYRVTRPPSFVTGFEKAFGTQWKSRVKAVEKKYFLPSRIVLSLPAVPEPLFEQNIPFCTVPGTDRQLLCDTWQPPPMIKPSGLAFIYLHGSAFYFLDKDLATRPLFRQLAAQGHVIMDVAYRLAPETDIMGMVHDAKRAVNWMRENARKYGVNPARIALGGASAGAHLAMLAAYTAPDPQFSPAGLQGRDTSVCGVISLYGSNDLTALYYHTNQHVSTRSVPGERGKKAPVKIPAWLIKKMGKEYHRLGMDKDLEKTGSLPPLLGGHPDEVPGNYAFFSPATHLHKQCPPTLLIHDEDDILAPVKTTRTLYLRLAEKKVPTILHILPQTDHGFDLIAPNYSPAAHNVLYDIEQFLALMQVDKEEQKEERPVVEKDYRQHVGITRR
jgi:acetyl esterase/lipase